MSLTILATWSVNGSWSLLWETGWGWGGGCKKLRLRQRIRREIYEVCGVTDQGTFDFSVNQHFWER